MKPAFHHPDTLGLLRSGDPCVLRALVEQHLDPVFAFVFHRVDRNRMVAEEVVQETFLAAVQRVASFRGESTVFSWLCAIARNQILMRRRKIRTRREPVAFSDLVLEADEEIADTLDRIEEQDLPEDVLQREETRRFVGTVMSTLPPDYQAGLLARYRDGKSVEEFARERGTTTKAAESLLYRARRAFAETFRALTERFSGGRDR